MRRADAGRELDVAAQVEFVGDVVEVGERLGLGREVLFPVPFGEEGGREGVGVAVGLGVEACAWVAVPVPGVVSGWD